MRNKIIGSLTGVVISLVIVFFAVRAQRQPTPVAPVVSGATADIKAPGQVSAGELVVLDAGNSQATGYIWKVVPETDDFLVIDGGKRAVFSATGGEYLFIVAVAQDGNVDLVTHSIDVGEGSQLDIEQWLDEVESPNKQEEAARLSQSFASVAAVANVDMTINEFMAATQRSNRDALGDSLENWKPFLKSLQGELKRRADSGQLTGVQSHIELWREISNAL